MDIPRRKLFGALAGVATATAATAKTGEQKVNEEAAFADFASWAIPHGGDCCGCAIVKAVGDNEFIFVCNECDEQLDAMKSEITYDRLVEALQRAHHALTTSSGLVAHDGKPEHAFTLDHTKELRFIDEALKLADVEPRVLEPLT